MSTTNATPRLRLHYLCSKLAAGTMFTALQLRDMYVEAAHGNVSKAVQLALVDVADARVAL